MNERTEEILKALADGDLTPVREETERRHRSLLQKWTRGMMTRREVLTCLRAYEYDWDRRRVMGELGYSWPFPAEDWAALRADWLDSVHGYEKAMPEEGPEREAAERRKKTLELLSALGIPVFTLERPPVGMPVPHWMSVYTGGVAGPTIERAVWIEFTDDGGFCEDPDPAGKTFAIRGDFGIEVRITVSCRQEPTGRIPVPAWIGVGSITHLTAAENRTDPTIRLSLTGQRGAIVNWQEDEKDREAYETDPLWEPLREWTRQMEDKRTLWEALLFSKPID